MFGNVQIDGAGASAKDSIVVQLSLVGDSGISSTATASYLGQGRFALSYTCTKSGSYTMSIAINGGASVQRSGAVTIVHAAAVAATSQLSAVSATSCIAGRDITFAVQLRDAYGNDCTSITTSSGLAISLGNAGSQVWSYHFVGLGSGSFQGTFEPRTSGSYDLKVKFASTLVQSGELAVTVSGSSTDHSKCIVDVSGSGLAQNGTAGATVSFEISTFDAFSNAVDNGSDDVFTFSLDGGDGNRARFLRFVS